MSKTRNALSAGRHLWKALIALAFGGFLLMSYVVWSAHREIWVEARLTAQSQVDRLEAQFDATLRRVDASLDDLAFRLPREAMDKSRAAEFRPALEAQIDRMRRSFPEVAGFRVIDAQGDVLYLAGGGDYVNLAERSYFRELQAAPATPIVFSEVVQSRITGRKTVVAAKPVRDEAGRFLGIVSSAIELEHFGELLDAIRVGPHGVIAIRRSSTHDLVVQSHASEVPAVLPASHPVRWRMAGGETAGVFERDGEDGDVVRVWAFRTLKDYPFYVMAGLDQEDVMAVWRQRASTVGMLGIVLFLSLCFVLLWLARVQHRESKAVEKLERHRRQLREAQRLAQIGSWEFDIVDNRLSWSDELYRILELDPQEAPATYEQFLARVHADDRDRVDRAYRQSVERHEPYEVEHRMIMADGRVKLVRECGETVYADDGTPLRSIGTAQDMTGIRQLESQMELLGSAFQHGGEAIVITDCDNNIVLVNPAFTRLTGYTKEDVIGRNPRILSAGRNTPADYQRMWQGLRENGFWQGEIWDRRKDGGIYPKWLSISVIRDEEGAVRYYIAHFTDVSSERAAEARLHHMAHHDVLTGLYNRASLKERLDHGLAVARRENAKIALLFIDLDRFKVINDTLGHHVGDELLIQVGRRLRSCVRESDVVARLGGDEFVIMLTGVEHSSTVAMIAEKLVSEVNDPYQVGVHQLYTSPSIGIAIFPTDGPDGETLMKNADAAMYHAKNAGRNNFQFFDARMNEASLERLKIENSLRQGLGRDEFLLHFQPIVDVRSGRVAGLEALVRWQHPERGLLFPGTFIGVAEETGLIMPLGDWVFWAACRQLAEFRRIGIRDVKMSLNISAIQMRNGNLDVLTRGAIEAYDLEPGDLIFEITESVAMQQPEETVRILDILHDMGVTLALDDFGTGYSSLSYLRMFALNHLKLDRSFVQEIGQDADGQVICDATIGLAHNLGLKLIAEGVETEEQLDYLRGRGCDLVQGYLFSKPLPADQAVDFIRQRNG
ncbi:MAG: EAL domain-containing protein [Dechloromonas sp.]|nr:EAL domain-containing protein [Dechloromonas sp.]